MSYDIKLRNMVSLLREERRLRVFENRAEPNIWTQEYGEWRKVHSEGLHSLYLSYNLFRVVKSRRLRWAGHVARMGESRSDFKVFFNK